MQWSSSAIGQFIKLKGFGWPGFSSYSLLKQDKGHKNQLKYFLESVKNGKESPIPFNEILEVSRATINIADQ